MKNKQPTLEDVARQAEVSTASVSRYLNAPDLVRPERRARIEAAVSALGYVPHGAARALASQRTRTIGAVIPTLDNAIFAQGVQAFQRRLHAAGFTLLLASSDYDLEEERQQVENLLTRGVDGLMLVGFCHSPRLHERLQGLKLPFVNTWVFEGSGAQPCVGFDNRQAAKRVASYLLDIGHRDLAMISGPTRDNDRAEDRMAGVREALMERGISPKPGFFVERPYDIGEGRGAMRSLLEAGPGPTAVVCGNDLLAVGALLECQARGIDVPRRLSITGFDDMPLASHLPPGLTTMRVPTGEMGRRAAEYLIARLQKQPIPDATELEVGLILRGTTAPPLTGNLV